VASPRSDPPSLNPRGRKHDKNNAGFRFRLGSPLPFMLLVALGFLLFRNVFQDAGVHRVTYSEFKQAAREGKFSHVQLSPDVVKGFLVEPQRTTPESSQRTFRSEPAQLPWLARRVPGDDELISLLESKHVDYEQLPSSSLGDAFWIWVVPL